MAWKNVQYDGETGKMKTSAGGGGGASTLADLDDTSISSPSNGQVLKYNSETSKWENDDESGGGGTVTDVQVDGTSVVDPQTGAANIEIPVKDVTYDGQSIVNPNTGEAEIPAYPTPDYPVVDVKVNGTSVLDSDKEAQIISYKEVTQSEYNALPESKLNDGVAYFIKDLDDGCYNQFPPRIYSFEEREIGVWVDGRPLYELTKYVEHLASSTDYDWKSKNSVVNYSSSSASVTTKDIYFRDTLFDLLYDDLGKIPRIDIVAGPKGHMVLSGVRIAFSDWDLLYNIQDPVDGKLRITIGNTTDRYSWDAYITIQYTKASDTPGSGSWTNKGGLARHYIENEQVVGTYHGKTLYEKSWFGLTAPDDNDPHNLINIEDLHIDRMVSMEGSIDIPGNTTVSGSGAFELWYRKSSVYGFYVAILINNDDYFNGDTSITIRYTKE